MVNSSGLFELLPELAAALDPEPSQPASESISASISANTAANAAALCLRFLRRLMAGSSFPPPLSIAPTPSYKRPAPDDRLTEQTGSCVRHRENPAGWRHRVC